MLEAVHPVAGDRFAVPEATDPLGEVAGHPIGLAISGDTIVAGAL